MTLAGALGLVALLLPAGGHAAVTVTGTTWFDLAAYRLSDGVTEAVVAPAIMRVVRYGAVGGENWLWTSDARQAAAGEWANWGGDKTWLAPQLQWPGGLVGRSWPPDDAWEMRGVVGDVPDGMRISGPVSAATGVRIVRTYTFNARGEFVITQRAEKEGGGPVVVALWSVTQVRPPDAVFLPINPGSRYRDGFHDFGWGVPAPGAAKAGRRMIRLRPDLKQWFKVGTDAPVSGIAAVRGQAAFVERAPHPTGKDIEYPDGATGSGCPVELFNADGAGKPDARYMELELLSPLTILSRTGAGFEHAVRWSLHAVPPGGPANPKVVAAVDRLLHEE